MKVRITLAFILVGGCAFAGVHLRAQSDAKRLAFDVVSIKPNTAQSLGSNLVRRPDGGLTMLNVPTITILARAFEPIVPKEMRGLPRWTSTERYDVRATSALEYASPEQRRAMIRALLADRFKLVAHVESRQESVYRLVLARADGRPGPGLVKSDLDCVTILDARAANPLPASPAGISDFMAGPPPCSWHMMGAELRDAKGGDGLSRFGSLLEGEARLDDIGSVLRMTLDRPIVNKTGLTGAYRTRMNFRMTIGGRPPEPGAVDEDVPSIFTAMQEQLGLRLEPGSEPMDFLVIDHIEHPTGD